MFKKLNVCAKILPRMQRLLSKAHTLTQTVGQPAVLPEPLTMIHEHRETHSKHTLKISLISARIICLVVPESGVACCCIAQTSFPVFVRLSVVCCCGIFRGLGPSRVSGVCFGESTYK